MRLSARRFRGFLLSAALVIGGASVAQELQFDPKALDTSGASSVQTKRGRGKKGAPADAAASQSGGKPGAQPGGPNRQFGELEGWSPGKAPPKPKEKDDAPSRARAPVSVSPNGNMGTGFAF